LNKRSNETFSFLKLQALLQRDDNEVDMSKIKNMNADEVDLSELPVEIEKFKLYLIVAQFQTASYERSFSKLSLIKSYLRSTVGEDRLSALFILSIENDFVGKLKFDDIISGFSSVKARLVDF